MNFTLSILISKIKNALALIDRYRDLPQKSPALAGVMPAIIPGSGYMNVGHYGDGASAFLINGLFIAGTVIGINEENHAVTAIVGGIEIPFYLGNIYGSTNAAKKWNRAAKEEVCENTRLHRQNLLIYVICDKVAGTHARSRVGFPIDNHAISIENIFWLQAPPA